MCLYTCRPVTRYIVLNVIRGAACIRSQQYNVKLDTFQGLYDSADAMHPFVPGYAGYIVTRFYVTKCVKSRKGWKKVLGSIIRRPLFITLRHCNSECVIPRLSAEIIRVFKYIATKLRSVPFSSRWCSEYCVLYFNAFTPYFPSFCHEVGVFALIGTELQVV